MEPLIVDTLLNKIVTDLKHYLLSHRIEHPVLIGIRTGGVWIAEHIHQALRLQEPLGILDISFYRDDFSHIGLNPHVKPSFIPGDIEGRHILLVDDVLQTGRTCRAALNEVFDYGRPASVTLVCLIELEGRELPIRPDIVGKNLLLPPHLRIKLKGPYPLNLVIKNTSELNDEPP